MLTTPTREVTLKLLIFPLGDLFLGLKLEGVRKVIPRPEIFQGKNAYLGLCHFEDQEVTVVDLYQKILGKSYLTGKSYLVVLQSPKGWYGLTVGNLPMMREVPRESFRPVPEEYRERDTLGIASHSLQVALEKDKFVTVFLLDEARVLELIP